MKKIPLKSKICFAMKISKCECVRGCMYISYVKATCLTSVFYSFKVRMKNSTFVLSALTLALILSIISFYTVLGMNVD